MTTSQDHKIQLPFTTSHAFIIGINDYKHVSPLRTAVNDAREIARLLREQHGFTVHPPLLNATHQELNQLLLEQIPRLAGEGDRILFYFAGHGIALDSEEGPNGYLVAADTKPGQEETLISMNGLHDAITNLPCRHGLLVLDCCFSGAFKWSSGFRDVVFDLPKVIYEERFWRYCKDPAWQVITSAAHDQKAVDIITNQSLGLREEGSRMHSPFASALMAALSGDADVVPAGQGDGVITATELYSYLRDLVETKTTENVKRQSPSMFNLQKHDKGEFIFLSPKHRFNLPPTPDRNPFMGLSSYNEEDAALFYGRDRVIEALLEKVTNHPLAVVSGASGTGKSSVIKAGILPRLRKEGYTILPIIRPGKEPMQAIAAELPDIGQQLADGPAVLVIDQYEELITQCLHQEERDAFEKQIAQWIQLYPSLRILLSIRSDFEPQFESEVLARWWQPGRYVVPAFSLEEVREVITRPAAQAVLFYEPEDLADQLSEEVSQAPGALPLLSFTLSELYHAYLKSGREDRALTEEDYRQLGGVIGALRTRADAEYQALGEEEKNSMRNLMLRMSSLEGGELAGRRIYADELNFSNPAETERLQSIAGRLVEARLLLKGKDSQGRIYIEPAHDALVRAWARLWEWIKAVGEEKIMLQFKLNQAVNDYFALLQNAPKKARNLLWASNPRLDLMKAELDSKSHNLNAKEETFIRSSVQRRTARKRRSWAIAFTVMAGLAGLAVFAYTQKILADNRAWETQAAGLGSKALALFPEDNTVAMNLAMAGFHMTPDPVEDTRQALFRINSNTETRFYRTIGMHEGKVSTVEFSPTGDTVLTAGEDGQIMLWNHTGQLFGKLRGGGSAITDAAFSADGKHIIYGTQDGKAVLLDRAGRVLRSVNHGNPVTSVIIAKTKNNLYGISGDSLGSVLRWDISGDTRRLFYWGQYRDGSEAAICCLTNIYGLRGEESRMFDKEASYYTEAFYFASNEAAWGNDRSFKMSLDGDILEVREHDTGDAPHYLTQIDYEPLNNDLMHLDITGGASVFRWPRESWMNSPDSSFFKTSAQYEDIADARILPSEYTNHPFYFEALPDVLVARGEEVVWFRPNGQEKMRFSRHTGGIATIDVSGNGWHLATGGNDGRVLLWNIHSYIEVEDGLSELEWYEPKWLSYEELQKDTALAGRQYSDSIYRHPGSDWVLRPTSIGVTLSRNGIDLQEFIEVEPITPLGSVESFAMSEDGRFIYTKHLVGNEMSGRSYHLRKWPNYTYLWENGLTGRLSGEEVAQYNVDAGALPPPVSPLPDFSGHKSPDPVGAASGAQTFGYVTGDNVRVRKTPEISPAEGHIVTSLNTGTRVELLEERQSPGEPIPWYRIRSESYEGWMRSDFVHRSN